MAIVPTLDCGCRSLLGLTVTTDQTGPAVLASVEQAPTAAFGSPAAVPEGVERRSDHGPQYTGADCAALVARWGLPHTFAAVGRRAARGAHGLDALVQHDAAASGPRLADAGRAPRRAARPRHPGRLTS